MAMERVGERMLDSGGGQQEMRMEEFPKRVDEYRTMLLGLEQQMQSAYDKAVMTLSGGALGISLTFLKDVADKTALRNTGWLLTAWILWGLSVTSVLASFFTSSLALRKAIRQTDERLIYVEVVGGRLNQITSFLNPFAGLLFFLGVVSIVLFVGGNIR